MKKFQVMLLTLAVVVLVAGGTVLLTQPALSVGLCTLSNCHLCSTNLCVCIPNGGGNPQTITCQDWCTYGNNCPY